MKYENKRICKKCGGMCCLKSGCDYFVKDFKTLDEKSLIDILSKGNISIVSSFYFKQKQNDKQECIPFLYLRARNKDRDIVDLFSMKKQCSMLTSKGCTYKKEDRPSGGLNLIPKTDIFGEKKCYPYENVLEEMHKWEPYQELLSKLVFYYSGKTVKEKLEEDVENVFYQVITRNFEDISLNEIDEVLDILEIIKPYYKKSKDKALNRQYEEQVAIHKCKNVKRLIKEK